MKNPSTPEKVSSFIRLFRAAAVVAVGIGLGWFVYGNVTQSDAMYPFKLGLDLAGGSHLVYEAEVSSIAPAEVDDLMNVLRDVIERRVNIFGVSEPIVQVESGSFVSETKSQRLVVELPGVTDVATAVAEIGKTPLLEFKLIDANAAAQAAAQEQMIASIASGTPGVGISIASSSKVDPYIPTEITGRYLESASLEFTGGQAGQIAGEPIVSITFTKEGADLFEQITRDNTGEQLAIFLDGEVISAPRINEAISGGKAVISGGFTPDEARALTQNLNFGALPVPIVLVSTQTIGASLGDVVVERGIIAGLAGIVFVIVFMVVWYRLPGMVAAVALLFYVAVMLALFQLVPVTLTAAGLAGFILSLGMAVDANVLVFERMKEEFRAGKDSNAAAKEGFLRAWSAIRDGNVTSLLSAIILFWFGTSIVKGFALVFGLGVIMSMITALLVTRTLLLALPVVKIGDGIKGKLFNSGFSK